MNIKFIFFVIFIVISSNALSNYKGSAQNGNKGFWHTSKIDRIQLGWDKRIYVFLKENSKCESDHIFYHPKILIGREMILTALLKYEEQNRTISFRIDECKSTTSGVKYGVFDKIEARPLIRSWLGNIIFNSISD